MSSQSAPTVAPPGRRDVEREIEDFLDLVSNFPHRPCGGGTRTMTSQDIVERHGLRPGDHRGTY